MELYGVLVELDVFSEISVAPPLIAPSTTTLPAPPPTSLLGALAYPYLREKKIPEMIYVDGKLCSPAMELLNSVHYASAGYYARIEQKLLERVNQTFYLRRAHLGKVEMIWTVAQRGMVNYADDKLFLFFIISDQRLIGYAWGITRIGRKESIVIVRNITAKPLKDLVTNEREGITRFYAPKYIAEWCEGSTEVEMYILDTDNLCKAKTPKTEKFLIPNYDGMYCRASDKGVFLKIDAQVANSQESFLILVPRNLVGV